MKVPQQPQLVLSSGLRGDGGPLYHWVLSPGLVGCPPEIKLGSDADGPCARLGAFSGTGWKDHSQDNYRPEGSSSLPQILHKG